MTGTNGLNTSGIHPTKYNVLVEPKEVQKATKGGLLMPDEVVEKEGFARTEGILVEASPMAFSWPDWPEGAEKPAIGQRVMFAKYNATEMKGADGKNYWLMNDEAIVAVVDEADE